jgi:hypothetical protein
MTDDAPAPVTFAAYARLHHVSRPTVWGWRKRGYLVLQNGRVDVVRSNERLAARPDVHRGGVAKVRPGKPAPIQSSPAAEELPADGWSMHEAKRREMVATAKMRELTLAREAGKVSDNAEVAEKVGKRFSVVRARMLAISSKLAARLAVLNTAEACGALLDIEIRDALTELSTIP